MCVVSYVPLRGVMAKMNKSDRPETGRIYLFHNAGTIITHSAQKEKRNGEKNAAFSGANRAGAARKNHEILRSCTENSYCASSGELGHVAQQGVSARSGTPADAGRNYGTAS